MTERAEKARDRRGSPRSDAHSLVLLLEEDAPHQGDRCWLVNVSEGGLAVRVPEGVSAEVGSTVLVEMPLGCSLSRIRTRCNVVGISAETPPVIHLSFVDDSSLFRSTIRSSLAAWRERLDPIPGGVQGVWRQDI